MHVDVASQVGAVVRRVEGCTHEGAQARAVIAGRRYDTDIADLWDAITNADRIPRWFSPVTGDLHLGGRYQVQGNAGGTITACEAPHLFTLTWEFGGQTSWVEVRLTAAGDATDLELRHIAPTGPEFDGFWDQFGPGAVGVGWDLGLLGLALHIDSGASVPPEAQTDWPTSDNGRSFATASSEQWRLASIAFGTAPDAADSAAANTTAFYTGEQQPA